MSKAEWRAVSGQGYSRHGHCCSRLSKTRLQIVSLWWAPVRESDEYRGPFWMLASVLKRMAQASSQEQVAVLFGREDRGLTNEELRVCNLHLNIPTSGAYSSLNLAMAVQIVAYELHMLSLSVELPVNELEQWDSPFASQGNMEHFYQHLEETLIDVEFLDPTAPRQLMSRLRRLYTRVRLDEMELNILRGVLSETQKWVKRARKGS